MPAHVPMPDIDAIRHTKLEDAQGLGVGVLLCAFGINILAHLGLMTGQTAGVALIASYLSGWSFGLCFFLVNLPFWWLAKVRMGWEFTLKSLGCVLGLSVAADLMPRAVQFDRLDPAVGAIMFGLITGLGLLAVFRHKGSLGGLGIVALLVQDTTGFRAGYVQLIVDAAIFAVAALLFDWQVVAYSLLGAVCLNGVIAFNHRRDRYIAP